jgi:hypothetical protein
MAPRLASAYYLPLIADEFSTFPRRYWEQPKKMQLICEQTAKCSLILSQVYVPDRWRRYL